MCRILPCPRTYFHERIRCRLDSTPAEQFAVLQLRLRLSRAVSMRFSRAPFNRTAAGSGCRDKAADRKSCNKLIAFAVDANLTCANNLRVSRFALRRQTERARALEVKTSRVMRSSADSGGGIDESWTTAYLSRTRQGKSTTSKKRRHWPTQQPQHEMRERSLRWIQNANMNSGR